MAFTRRGSLKHSVMMQFKVEKTDMMEYELIILSQEEKWDAVWEYQG